MSQPDDKDELFRLNWLDKREYFAGLALQGLLANPEDMGHDDPAGYYARLAVIYADKLIKELNQTKEGNHDQ